MVGRRRAAGREREQVDSDLRLHDALDAELEAVDGQLAQRALADADVRRLMTIPGVGPVTALSLRAVIGEVARFPSAGQLVGYLGLDPRVRQFGERPGSHRPHLACRSGARTRAAAQGRPCRHPHAGTAARVHARLKARRGPQVALVRTARKLAVLSWHLLSKDEDYRYGAPTITQRKLRRLQHQAGDQGPKSASPTRQLACARAAAAREEAERNYRAHVAERAKAARVPSLGKRLSLAHEGQTMRGRPSGPRGLLFSTGSPAPGAIVTPNA